MGEANAEPADPAFELPVFKDVESERLHRKQRLAAGFRLFARRDYDEGIAGHITVRDPEHPDTFWVNPVGMHFSTIRASDLVRVDAGGAVVEGERPCNRPAFVIHSRVHDARPDVVAAAHAHAPSAKAFSATGRLLAPLSQDACAFFDDHALFDDFTGVVYELSEADRIAAALGGSKAVILRNHGLLTVGQSVDAALWWFIAFDRCCHAQLLAEAAGSTVQVSPEYARLTAGQVGTALAGFINFQPLYAMITREEPDLLE